MKKICLFFILALNVVIFFNACKKNPDAQAPNEQEPFKGSIPDLATKVNASVDGFITDELGNPVAGAIVKGTNVSATTNAFGYFKISNEDFPKSAGFVEAVKTGYFKGVRTFIPVAGEQHFVRIQLIKKTIVGTVDASQGGTVTVGDGAIITMPAGAVVVADGGNSYNGTVSIAAHWLDPSAASTELTMPGDLTGINTAGYLQALESYGMMAVELTGSAGELLQVASGKKASLHFPLPASFQSQAPASIPLWYFDESTGLWKEEGAATKSGDHYEADVAHFSTWNCDINFPPVNFTVRILDMDNNPLMNIPVSIEVAGSICGPRTSYTDRKGRIYCLVQANTNLIVKVKTICHVTLETRNITSGTTDIDLGDINIDPLQYSATFSGTVTNCDSEPLDDGSIILMSGGYTQCLPVVNGVFSQTVLGCFNSSNIMIAVDNETGLQSSPQSITITPGLNTIGNFSVCSTSNTQYITYTLDGIPTAISTNAYWLYGIYSTSDQRDFIMAASFASGGADTYKFIWYGSPEGVHDSINPNVMLEQKNYILQNHPVVNMTRFPHALGEFYTASVSGAILKDALDNSLHTFSTTINVIRSQ